MKKQESKVLKKKAKKTKSHLKTAMNKSQKNVKSTLQLSDDENSEKDDEIIRRVNVRIAEYSFPSQLIQSVNKMEDVELESEMIHAEAEANNKNAVHSISKSKRKYKKSRNENFSRFIHKVLKNTYPEISISKKAMDIMNSFVHDIIERLVNEVSKLIGYSGRKTLLSRDMQTACKFLLSGELQVIAISEASRALNKYLNSLHSDNANESGES
ncbi:hypothetical protein PVAND_001947 [Polypedilum vanderplanki]|uniref:Core Histone H2A/H2B/H3 domain-containing protein n=1 Tax=Polypedilum vanderplanki TaxID=319348 RepID=A0A9J6BPH2_POLVA|nr:hypothetical protein PVAND_001947 [Polypedilum vanderplanki]